MDTIYALSSGAVPSGVAVIRVSGPHAGGVLRGVAGGLPAPRSAELRLFKGADGAPLDRGLVIWFPAPASFTGEDVAEFHVHGGRAVIQAMFDAIGLSGARYAAPGEFSRRAFLTGKLDLVQAEGLADLIGAETEWQRRQALQQAQGRLSQKAEGWRSQLIAFRAEVEARLDFSDEGDVPSDVGPAFWETLDILRTDLQATLAQSRGGEMIREGFRVAILGRPNAGKSSLLNALARREVAIVTDEPGTTRDVLEVPLDLGGYAVRLFDTAGLREASSAAEREGVRRAAEAADRADLVLWLEDCRFPPEELPLASGTPVWRVRTKADLCPCGGADGLAISALGGSGVEELVSRIGAAASSLSGAAALITRQRHREAVADAVAALDLVRPPGDEIAADLLRSASDAIARLTGRIDVEDVLDRVFGEFCIGK